MVAVNGDQYYTDAMYKEVHDKKNMNEWTEGNDEQYKFHAALMKQFLLFLYILGKE